MSRLASCAGCGSLGFPSCEGETSIDPAGSFKGNESSRARNRRRCREQSPAADVGQDTCSHSPWLLQPAAPLCWPRSTVHTPPPPPRALPSLLPAQSLLAAIALCIIPRATVPHSVRPAELRVVLVHELQLPKEGRPKGYTSVSPTMPSMAFRVVLWAAQREYWGLHLSRCSSETRNKKRPHTQTPLCPLVGEPAQRTPSAPTHIPLRWV